MENYIFSGFGHAAGKYKITNESIIEAVRKDYLHGFREDRILESSNYKSFKKEHPNVSAFDYFAGYKMGFFTRHHVTPFPPTRKKLYYAETSLELGVKGIKNAIEDANLQIKDISAWFLSTVSSHEQAPGIASTIKAYFTDFNNNTPCFTLTSGCSGFNINLERAVEYLKSHKEAKHVVVAHTETMSSFLTQRLKFVPFVTFGDACAAVVLSKVESNKKEGVINIKNYHDMHMVDFVGVDKQSNLYMEDSVIKDRAIVNMTKSGNEILDKSNWTTKDVDLYIPHQTGSAILIPTAKNIGLNENQLFLEAQKEFGNVSGATVAIGLSMLNKEDRLVAGQKILSTVAGVGGNYGAFTYICPELDKKKKSELHLNDLKGKTCLITGGTGALGQELCLDLARRGAHIILQYNKSEDIAQKLQTEIKEKGGSLSLYQIDFTQKEDIKVFIEKIKSDYPKINYLIHAAGIAESPIDNKPVSSDVIMQVNAFSAIEITVGLLPILKETVVYLGTAAEDIHIDGFPCFVSSKSYLHGAAGSAAGELISQGIRTVYYMPAVLDKGLSKQINPKTVFKFMMKNGQEKPICIKETATRIISSLYIPKVINTTSNYEGPMVVRRDGYVLETDI